MKKQTRLFITKLFIITAIMILTGCRTTGSEAGHQKQRPPASEETAAGPPEGTEVLPLQENSSVTASGSMILEDTQSLYACSIWQILKIDKKSGKSCVLWANEKETDSFFQFRYGNALLLEDKIYFISIPESASLQGIASLAMIRTDGTGYTKIADLEDENPLMFYKDGILYLSSYDSEEAFRITQDGKCFKLKPEDLDPAFPELPYGCQKYRGLNTMEILTQHGCCFMYDLDYNLLKLETESGIITQADWNWDRLWGGSILGNNDNFFLSKLSKKNTDNDSLYYTNIETLQTKYLADLNWNSNFIDMDNSFAYFVTEVEDQDPMQTICLYQRVSLITGKIETLFEQAMPCGTIMDQGLSYIMDLSVTNGYLYYPMVKDYRIYLMRRNVETPAAAELLGEALYDSRIVCAGHIEIYYEDVYSEIRPKQRIANINLKRLVLDDKYPGADEINRWLRQDEEQVITYMKESSLRLEDVIGTLNDEEAENFSMYCFYSRDITKICYLDDNYISFKLEDHNYQGGAHGMFYWTGCTFDLQSGQRLQLSDIVANSEEELNEIITNYFTAMINEYPVAFEADAIETVRNSAGFDTEFYLTDSGIRFYYSPYQLACFAAGFQQVTIPYAEFEMKIPVG